MTDKNFDEVKQMLLELNGTFRGDGENVTNYLLLLIYDQLARLNKSGVN